jgi:DNA mismatch repair protein MutS2
MMTSLSDIFINNLPTLDLHGYDRDSGRVLLEDFLLDNYKLGNQKVVIIHGYGTSILKKEVHNTLHKNKYVMSYKLHNFNNGCTIVNLIKNEDITL